MHLCNYLWYLYYHRHIKQKDTNSEEKSAGGEIKQFYQLGYNYYWIQRYVQSLTTAVEHLIFYNIIPTRVYPEVHIEAVSPDIKQLNPAADL